MQHRLRTWNDIRGLGFLIAVSMATTASLATWAINVHVAAKSPGESNCYKDVCHRVYTLDETRRMIGRPVELHATHYDDPSVDKMNTGEFTSSGETFDASNPGRTSASNYPDGTELLLWSPQTRRASHVRVNDFGPFWGKRTIDVTRRVADDLGFAKNGVAVLRVKVIWVPPQQAARYKKYRTYPMSYGLLGVVEEDQLEPLARRLILTADQRNRELLPRPIEPPDFAAEAAVIAAAEAALMPRRVADMVANLPRVELGIKPVDLRQQTYVGPPGLRAEAVTDVPAELQQAMAQVAEALEAMPRFAVLNSPPADLLPAPPVVIAAATQPSSGVTPSGLAVSRDPGPLQQEPGDARVALAGPTAANRSSVSVPLSAGESFGVPSSVARQASTVGADTAPSAGTIRSVEAPARVAIALAEPRFDFGQSGLSLWIGIAVMLTTFLGAVGFGRRGRRAAETMSAGVSKPSFEHVASTFGHDSIAIARQAAARAEADARELLAHETATREVASLGEAQARDDLVHEIARREALREAHMRLKFEVAAEAQADAQRELALIDAARRERMSVAKVVPRTGTVELAKPEAMKLEPVPVAARLPAAEFSSRGVPAARLPMVARMELPVAQSRSPIVVEAPPAVFPGVSDPKLAAAILGRSGSSAFWGNTIVGQARLDGTARSGSPLRIDGVVDGACYAPVILVSEGAVVTGVLAADTIIVLGTVSGTLSGRKITVAKSAQVEGEIFYQSMSIDPQAHCDVRFRRLAGDVDPVAVGTSVFDANLGDRTRAA